MNICICDDDENFIRQMHDLLQGLVPGHHLLSFTSGFEMLEHVKCIDSEIDILFLDMEMPGLNGLQTAAELRNSHPHLAVAVVTAYPQYAIASYDFAPIHYIVKPVSADNIQRCIDRAKISEDVLLIKSRDGVQYVQINKIYALESNGLKVCIDLEHEDISNYKTLGYYEKVLNAKGFYRIHSGAIINLVYVSAVYGNKITLMNQMVFYVSRRKKSGFMTALLKWRKNYE